jgi:hypothetical protein
MLTEKNWAPLGGERGRSPRDCFSHPRVEGTEGAREENANVLQLQLGGGAVRNNQPYRNSAMRSLQC